MNKNQKTELTDGQRLSEALKKNPEEKNIIDTFKKGLKKQSLSSKTELTDGQRLSEALKKKPKEENIIDIFRKALERRRQNGR